VGGKDPFDLERFVAAQKAVYPAVVDELRRGRKETHWIWFIFPQLKGLGRSATAQRYGIGSLAEASAYLGHPVLGARLRECARLLLESTEGAIDRIMPFPDDLKLQSSMTLFAEAADNNAADDRALFLAVIDRYFGGKGDANTLRMLPRGR
jgi:uncharacterized protein (DUF1810 family)